MGLDDAGPGVEMQAPDRLEQHGARLHPAGTFHEMLEQQEFARLQLDALAVAGDGARKQVKVQRPDGQLGDFAALLRAAGDGGDARRKLGHGEGLHDVVVGPGAQPVNLVVHRPQRGEEDHRRLDPGRAQRLDQRQPVEPGHHPVDDEQIVIAAHGLRQRLAPVQDVIHHMAFAGEPLADPVAGFLIVLCQKYAHVACPAPPFAMGNGTRRAGTRPARSAGCARVSLRGPRSLRRRGRRLRPRPPSSWR